MKLEKENSNEPLKPQLNIGAVSGSKIKCTCCPECGCKEYVNKNLVGDGYRICRECHQDWWIDIKYDSPYCY